MGNIREIYLAGGCFWGAEHYFKQIDGIRSTIVGFANGNTDSPTYKEVYTDMTGYAETVKVEYDASVISLDRLLKYYFCAIDPTSMNRQGEDSGTRYRTGIYYSNIEDRPLIDSAVGKERMLWSEPLAVEVEPLRNFYPAEDCHQNYLENNPDGYCHLPLKIFRYPGLIREIKALVSDEADDIAAMANFVAAIKEKMGFFWAGFYIVKDGQLVLGPFQGPVACTRIAYGKGVCGTAWKDSRTVIVPDVEEFPGHIACSSLSRSEIVVPVFNDDGSVKAVLDIDSTELSTFDRIDRIWLEEAVEFL